MTGNVEETSLPLEPITTTILEKKVEKSIKIRTFGKKQRISYLLWIFGNGMNLLPMLVFKVVPEEILKKRLIIFVKWLNWICFRSYPYKLIEKIILYNDKNSFHLTEDVINLFTSNKSYYRLIHFWLTSYYQLLDLSINKLFKESIKAKYQQFCFKIKQNLY